MGVRFFYKWLTLRYPTIKTEPSKNIKIDNLYIDMNGIIHNFFKNNTNYATYSEVFKEIFEYIDFLISIADPKELLFISIDGVAPRAKMNQQRTRRYSRDRERKKEFYQELNAQGIQIDNVNLSVTFDPNCITPGTEFQARLSEAIKGYLKEVKNSKPSLQVILCDSSVPGEGEHKIFSYIRNKRITDSNANLTHCVYGIDADLIMLGLVTHEPHFYIIKPKGAHSIDPKDLILVDLEVLRKYLEVEFSVLIEKKKRDLEKIIEDFVFMCILVGNDFLPNIPLLYINYGGLDELIIIYKFCSCSDFFSREGKIKYLIQDDGQINLQNLEYFFNKLAICEAQKIKEVTNNKPSEMQSYKSNFYKKKLKYESPELVSSMCSVYIRSLAWIFQYYSEGIPSWEWYYPFQYSPFASDFRDLSSNDIRPFEIGTPFQPFEQLMAVLPPWSFELLPKALQKYLQDPDSELIDMYPTKVYFDQDGGDQFFRSELSLIPFIEERRIKKVVQEKIKNNEISEEEMKRNKFTQGIEFKENGKEECFDLELGSYRSLGYEKVFLKEGVILKEIPDLILVKRTAYCGEEAIKRVKSIFNGINYLLNEREPERESPSYLQRKRKEGRSE